MADATQAPIDTESGAEQRAVSMADQPVTGFNPSDRREPAPDRVQSARETFTPPPPQPAIEVDPLGAATKKELRHYNKKVDDVRQAQRDAESLVGVTLRR